MDNPRADKVAVVNEVKERFTSSSAVLLTEYRGLNVSALAELRRSLREAGCDYKVYKNTLVRLAVKDAGLEIDDDMLVGPTALAFVGEGADGAPGDPVPVAKALSEFAKSHPDLVVKGGVMDDRALSADEAKRLANIESRDVLLARLAGGFAAPMQQFAGLLEAVPRKLAYGMQALIDKKNAEES